MESNGTAIGIPVHGWSAALGQTLRVLEKQTDPRLRGAHLIIVNSGSKFEYISNLYSVNVIPIPYDHYWGAAVGDIYDQCKTLSVERIILMNHDCAPEPDCLAQLLDFNEQNPKAIAHAALVYQDNPAKVWWAGSKQRFARRNVFLFGERPRIELPQNPYLVDSTMGQCMIIPIAAAQPCFLHIKLCPNSGADPVQTSCMRRLGFPVFIVPKAVSQTDQSDAGVNSKCLYIDSWKMFLRSLFHPVSARYLPGVIGNAYYIQDSKLGGILLAFYLSIGKSTYSLLEWFGLKRRMGIPRTRSSE